MKKLLSVFLAAVMALSAVSVLGLAVTASAEGVYVLYAYKKDGSCDNLTTPPAGVDVEYDNNLLFEGKRFLTLTISPEFTKTYDALYVDPTTSIGMVKIFVEGDVVLTASRMKNDGNIFYAGLGATGSMCVYPKSKDARLYVGGSFSGSGPDEPFWLLYAKDGVRVFSDAVNGYRMKLETYIDMRNAKSSSSCEAGPAKGSLTIDGADYKHTVRTEIALHNSTQISLKGRAMLDVEGYGCEASKDSQIFDRVIYTDTYTGAAYYRFNSILGFYITHNSDQYLTGYAGEYHYMKSTAPLGIGDSPLALKLESVSAAAVKKGIEDWIEYKLGGELKQFFLGKGFVARVAWTDKEGNPVADEKVRKDTAYTAHINFCPLPGYMISQADIDAAAKPDMALSAAWATEHEDHYLPAFTVSYPAISDTPPVIVTQPETQTLSSYAKYFSPDVLIYSLKAEHAASYQWHMVRTDGIDVKLSDGEEYAGTATATLRVLKPGENHLAKEFYCVVSAPGFDDVVSDHAAVKRVKVVSEVNLVDFELPVDGGSADTDFKVEDRPYSLVLGGLEADVAYLDPSTGEAVTAFAKGDKVRVKVTAKLTVDDYRFDVGTIVSVNGVMQAVNSQQDDSNAVFSFLYTVPADKYAITRASMELALPEPGDLMPYPTDVTGIPEEAPFGVFSFDYAPATERVKEDTPYTITFWLKADTDYYFDENAVFTVNGKTVTATFEKKNTVAKLPVEFPAQAMKTYPVESLNILELDAPVAGGAPDKEYRVEGTPHTPEGDLRVEYLDAETGEAKTSFARLDKIVVKVTVVRWNPKFVYADDLTAIWNGMEAKAVFTDEAKKYAEFRFNWIVGADAKEILYVPLTMAVPAVGEARPTGPDCILIPDATLYFVTTCMISPYDEQIQEGTEYTAKIAVKTLGDYLFSSDTLFTLNGKTMEEVEIGPDKDWARVTYVFPEKPGPEKPDPEKPAIPDNLGDVDGNGVVESADARLALRASVKLEDIKEGTDAFRAADIDGNGVIESSDARTILRLSVKLEDLDDLKAKYGK